MQNPFSRKNRLQGNILNGDFNGESRWLLQIEHFQHGMAAEKSISFGYSVSLLNKEKIVFILRLQLPIIRSIKHIVFYPLVLLI